MCPADTWVPAMIKGIWRRARSPRRLLGYQRQESHDRLFAHKSGHAQLWTAIRAQTYLAAAASAFLFAAHLRFVASTMAFRPSGDNTRFFLAGGAVLAALSLAGAAVFAALFLAAEFLAARRPAIAAGCADPEESSSRNFVRPRLP
jgi:hypothetical protein